MSVDRGDVERIAELARLRFEDEELELLTSELNRILEHVEALPGLEAGGAGTRDLPGDGPAATREPEGEPDAADAGSLAPAWEDGFFVVPPPPGVSDGSGEG